VLERKLFQETCHGRWYGDNVKVATLVSQRKQQLWKNAADTRRQYKSLKLNYGKAQMLAIFVTAFVGKTQTSCTLMRASATDVLQFTYFTIRNSPSCQLVFGHGRSVQN